MNNWNFNELTQEDVLDFKACKHNQTGKIYGIKDSSDCQSGKEIGADEQKKLALAASKGDAKAKATLNQIKKANAEQKDVEARKAKIQSDKKAKCNSLTS